MKMNDAFLRRIWVQALSDTAKNILWVLTDKLSLDDLAASTNRRLECRPVRDSSVASLSRRNITDGCDQLTKKLIYQGQSLSLEVKALKVQHSGCDS